MPPSTLMVGPFIFAPTITWTVCVIDVMSFAVLLEVFRSPPPDTVAVLVTDDGAFVATLTVTVIDGYAELGFNASLRVQVRVPRLQDQPVPEIAVAVRPVGRVSITVTVPELAVGPTLDTVMV